MVPRVMYRRVSELTVSNPFWPRSAYGYERTFSGPSTSVRFTLNFGHSRSEIALNAGLPRVGGRSEPKPLRSAFDPLRFPGDQAGAAPKCDVRPCPFHENH